MTDSGDLRLAEAIVARRTARGWKQADVAARGGLSLDRVQGFESGRVLRSRASTETKLELGLEWAPGSLDVVRQGHQPLGIEDMTAEQALMYTIEALVGAAEKQVWTKLDERCKRLGLTWKQVAWRADLDRTTPLLARLNRTVARAAEDGIEGAVQWASGSIAGIMLSHLDPECIDYPRFRPNDDRRTQPMALAAVERGLGRGLGRIIPTGERPNIVELIGESGLPGRAQLGLMKHVTERRAQLEASLYDEVQLLIEHMKAITDPNWPYGD